MTTVTETRPHWATCVRLPHWRPEMRHLLREAGIDAWRVPPGAVDEPVDVTLELFASSAADVRAAVVAALPDCLLDWHSFVYEPTCWPEPSVRFDWDRRGPLAEPWIWVATATSL